MVFAVSEGRITAVEKPTYQAPTSLRINDDLTQDYAAIYRTQPAVRTVVDFLARNVGQLSLHTFKRVSETDRKRLRDHPVAAAAGPAELVHDPVRADACARRRPWHLRLRRVAEDAGGREGRARAHPADHGVGRGQRRELAAPFPVHREGQPRVGCDRR
jgi:hypothetical protein